MKIQAVVIMTKTKAYPKGFLHYRVFGYGEFGGNMTYTSARKKALEYIEKHREMLWFVTDWKLKKTVIEIK